MSKMYGCSVLIYHLTYVWMMIMMLLVMMATTHIERNAKWH